MQCHPKVLVKQTVLDYFENHTYNISLARFLHSFSSDIKYQFRHSTERHTTSSEIMAPHSSLDVEVEGIRDTEGIVVPDPLLLDVISARRLKAGKLVAGVATLTSSDQFKSPVRLCCIHSPFSALTKSQTFGQPKAKRWDRKAIK